MVRKLILASALVLAAAGPALAEETLSGMLYHQWKAVQAVSESRFVAVAEIKTQDGKPLEYLQLWSIGPQGTLTLEDSVDLSTPASRTNRVQVTHHTKLDVSPEK